MAKSKGRTTVTYSNQFNDFKVVPLRTVKNKKYKFWVSKDKYNYVMNSLENFKDKVQLYKLRNDMHFLPYLPKKNLHLKNTLEAFNYYSHEQNISLPYMNNIMSDLEDIITNDIPFKIDGSVYLFHTYKILSFIRDSFLAYELSNNKEFIKTTITRYKRPKQSFQQNYIRHKKLYLKHKRKNKVTKVKSKSTHLLNSFVYRSLNYRNRTIKFFMGYFAMIGIDNVKMLQNDSYESLKTREALNMFMSARVSKEDCANSLSSVLYFYLHFKMRYKKSKALLFTKYIVDSVFDISNNYTGSELLKNLHINEVVGSHVVFGFSTKTKSMPEQQINYLEKKLLCALTESNIDTNRFAIDQVRPLINNPLLTYTQITPMELLEEY